jgi:alkanesulfonate monooxygenase SsuD/methylene tetrahydromethanopterin reductase-like flavin-dependent oxidoreductase (luciferase family)
MKYGVYLPNFGPYGDVHVLANLAQDAELAGWDGFFIWDHIAGWGFALDMADATVALTAIALRTRTIRFGALVTPLPRRRPHKVAREMASLDQLSHGRLIFGAGIGGGQDEWDHLGEETDLRKRGAMLDEALEVITSLWSGEVINFQGKYYRVQDTAFVPRPVQQPRIPVWIAARWPHKAPIRRAMSWDGLFPLFESEGEHELAEINQCMAYVRQLREGIDTPFDLVYAGCPTTPAENLDLALATVSQYQALGFTWWLENINPYAIRCDSETDEWPLQAMHGRIMQGPPRLE